MDKMIHDFLGNAYQQVCIKHITIEEDIETSVKCTLIVGDKSYKINASGNGVINTLYSAIQKETDLFKEHLSLGEITLKSLSVEKSPSCGAVAKLVVENSEKEATIFTETGPSIVNASVAALLKVLEYFMNAERVVVQLLNCIKDAEHRKRHDLVDKYKLQLSGIICNTSYTRTLERARAQRENDKC